MKMSDLVPGTVIKIGGRRFTIIKGDGYFEGTHWDGWRQPPSEFTTFWIRARTRGYMLRGAFENARVLQIAQFGGDPVVSGPIEILNQEGA